MPKAISTALKNHLAGSVTSICTCWLVTRTDGVMIGCTDHDQNLVISGVTYRAPTGYSRTAIASASNLSVDNMDVFGLLDSEEITEEAMRAGLFDFAAVQIFLVNWRDLSQGALRLRSGWLGEVVVEPTGVFRAEIRGLTQALTTMIGESFLPICRADLGDARCKVNLSSYSGTGTVTAASSNNACTVSGVSYTPGADETQATVTFVATAAATLTINLTAGAFTESYTVNVTYNSTDLVKWLAGQINASHASSGFPLTASENFTVDNVHSVTITKVNAHDSADVEKAGDQTNCAVIENFPGALIVGDAYLAGGLVTWLTGANTGVSMEIKSFVYDTGAMQLFLDMPFPIVAGDTFTYHPGCDKRRETCYFRYSNMANFRGEPDLPGIDEMLKYPDA